MPLSSHIATGGCILWHCVSALQVRAQGCSAHSCTACYCSVVVPQCRIKSKLLSCCCCSGEMPFRVFGLLDGHNKLCEVGLHRLLKSQNHISPSQNSFHCMSSTTQKLHSLSVWETLRANQMCKEAAPHYSKYLRKKEESFLKLGTTSRVLSCSFSRQQSG